MNRQNPLLSSFGLLATTLLLAGLGVTLWFTGGLAFSPGALSSQGSGQTHQSGFSNHAEFEKDCVRCHQPLESVQAVLCLDCHTQIKQQIEQHTQAHGRLSMPDNCRECHPDHRGREFDMLADARRLFDHTQASFSLIWHQLDHQLQPIECGSCHIFLPQLTTPDTRCAACHAKIDLQFTQTHQEQFGDGCLQCHDGEDRLARFDHAGSEFQLEGLHATVECAACHAQDQRFYTSLLPGAADAPQPACQDCHADPALHAGLFSKDCVTCHTPQGWHMAQLDGAAFDHATNAGFSLEHHLVGYDNQPVLCTGCHQSDFRSFDLQTCVACHSQGDQQAQFMQEHQDQFGPACLECHDGTGRLANFDHASIFPLTGSHIDLECSSCHVDRQFRGTPDQCFQCHQEPEIHAGVFGLQCESCHSTLAWTPAQLSSHNFPLDHGGQGTIACQTCHTTRYTEYTCYGCHDHQAARIQAKHLEEGISLVELPNCTKCHPTGREEESGEGD